MTRLLPATLLLTLNGCCGLGDASEPIEFDVGFTEAEIAVMLPVLEEWYTAMDIPMPEPIYGHKHDIKLSTWATSTEPVVYRLRESEPITIVLRAEHPRFLGLASPLGPMALAVGRMGTEENLAKVWRHELAHHFGRLKHADAADGQSLMIGSVDKDAPCIDAETLEKVCECQDCGDGAAPSCD